MHYLTGGMNSKHRHLYENGVLGHMKTPLTGYHIDHVMVWAMDNGAFVGAYPGDEQYLALLHQLALHADRCLFAAAPDVLYDAEATLAQFSPMAAVIRSLGYPVALVGQDGMENLIIPWDEVDWLFVGGSTEWKLGAGGRKLIEQAKQHDKRVHIGRVNSRKRFQWALLMGADSVDGNTLAFRPDAYLPIVLSWTNLNQQLTLL